MRLYGAGGKESWRREREMQCGEVEKIEFGRGEGDVMGWCGEERTGSGGDIGKGELR